MTLPRRFYTSVSVSSDLVVLLDGKPVMTPRKALLKLPNRALAEAVALEWEEQGELIGLEAMHANKLANTAIDRVPAERAKILKELLAYAGSDLVCYRATEPAKLVERQKSAWDPVLDWAKLALDADFIAAPGVTHKPQRPSALHAFENTLLELNAFELSGFLAATALTGSALLAMMVRHRATDPESAWLAAHVDEDYQIAQWGEDEEARKRRQRRHTEYASACRFMELSK